MSQLTCLEAMVILASDFARAKNANTRMYTFTIEDTKLCAIQLQPNVTFKTNYDFCSSQLVN